MAGLGGSLHSPSASTSETETDRQMKRKNGKRKKHYFLIVVNEINVLK